MYKSSKDESLFTAMLNNQRIMVTMRYMSLVYIYIYISWWIIHLYGIVHAFFSVSVCACIYTHIYIFPDIPHKFTGHIPMKYPDQPGFKTLRNRTETNRGLVLSNVPGHPVPTRNSHILRFFVKVFNHHVILFMSLFWTHEGSETELWKSW